MATIDTQSELTVPPPWTELVQLLSQHWKREAIHVAAELRIADALADGPRTLAELAETTGTHAASLYQLMRALSSIGLFAEFDGSRFINTELSQLLRPEAPGSMYVWGRMDRDLMLRPWEELMHSVRTGEPGFDKVHGVPMWRYFAERDPAAGAMFNAAMSSLSTLVDLPIAHAAALAGVSTIVDVGGGHGSLLTALLATYPSLETCILFDQPHVIDEIRTACAPPLDKRIKLTSGDFFATLPAGADVYVMKWILHDWNDAACINLLSTCRRAMASHGRLLAAELVIDPNRKKELLHFYDLMMLVLLGGKERTAEEFHALYNAAGLRLTRIIPTASMFCLIEGVPKTTYT